MPDTSVQRMVAGVYGLLRRPSRTKLAYQDVLGRLNDQVRGYLQSMSLSAEELSTDTADAAVTVSGIDFLLKVSGVVEFDPVHLEWQKPSDDADWHEGINSSFISFERHRKRTDYVAYVFFDQARLDDGVKIRLNIPQADIADYNFRMAYRVPLLTAIAKDSRIDLPKNFLSMVKIATALACIPMVRDDSKEWNDWVAKQAPVYMAELQTWHKQLGVRLAQEVETASQRD